MWSNPMSETVCGFWTTIVQESIQIMIKNPTFEQRFFLNSGFWHFVYLKRIAKNMLGSVRGSLFLVASADERSWERVPYCCSEMTPRWDIFQQQKGLYIFFFHSSHLLGCEVMTKVLIDSWSGHCFSTYGHAHTVWEQKERPDLDFCFFFTLEIHWVC